MKYLITYILFLFIIFSNAGIANQKSIRVTSMKELALTDFQVAEGDSVFLHIANIEELKVEKINVVLSLPWFSSITHLKLSNASIKGFLLSQFLNLFKNNDMCTLELHNIQIEGINKFLSIPFLSKLKTLKIINTPLYMTFYENLTVNGELKLKHLELVNTKLGEKQLSFFKGWNVLTQLSVLNLSGNPVENTIFTIFPFEEASQLTILKLNDCDLTIANLKSYELKMYGPEYPAIVKQISDEFYVDWQSVYFKNIQHLELQNKTKALKSINLLFKEPRFQHLNVFFNFYPEYTNNDSKNKINSEYIQLLHNYAKSDLTSSKTNCKLENLIHYNILRNSDKKNVLENLILFGDFWDEIIIRNILDENEFKQLKNIELTAVTIPQKKMEKIINDFPQYCFDVSFSKKIVRKNAYNNTEIEYDPPVWPEFTEELTQ